MAAREVPVETVHWEPEDITEESPVPEVREAWEVLFISEASSDRAMGTSLLPIAVAAPSPLL